MPDWTLPHHCTLVAGASGSGKTTFCQCFLLNRSLEQGGNPAPAAVTFVFDYKLEFSQRLGIPAVGTWAQCEAALAARWVVFNPFIMFCSEEGKEAPERRAFAWFCSWVYDVSRRGPGRKVFHCDEAHNFLPTRSDMLPAFFSRILREGRAEDLEVLLSTQFPKDYARIVRSSVTEWVMFNTVERDELDAVRPYFPGVDRAAQLRPGEFLAVNRHSGAELAGRVF